MLVYDDTKPGLEPDRPGWFRVLWIRIKGVLSLILRGHFRELTGHVMD